MTPHHRSSYLAVAAATALAAITGNWCVAQTIDNAFGSWAVPKFTPSVSGGSFAALRPAADGTRSYGFLALRRVPNSAERLHLENEGLLHFLSVQSVDDQSVVYRVRYRAGLAGTREVLYRASAHFHNLVPITIEDRGSRKILLERGFATGETDTADGGIYATVWYFGDVRVGASGIRW